MAYRALAEGRELQRHDRGGRGRWQLSVAPAAGGIYVTVPVHQGGPMVDAVGAPEI